MTATRHPDPPRVSVLLPVYNGMPLLVGAAESILSQSYRDLELLLVDDGSTDGSAEACDAFAAHDSRVRVLRHRGRANRGLVASLNLGLAEARGAYIARMDADDRSYPERLARQVAFLDQHPHVGVLGSAVHITGALGEEILWPAPQGPAVVRWRLCFGICLTHPTVVMRGEAVRAVGGYRADAPHNEDYDLWIRMSENVCLDNLDEALLYFETRGADNIGSRFLAEQTASTLDLQRRVISTYLLHQPPPHVAADLHALVFARPLPGSTPGETVTRIDAAARLLVALSRAVQRKRRTDAADVRADTVHLLEGFAWDLRERAKLGRSAALRLHASWSPGLFARSVLRRSIGYLRMRLPR